MYKKKVSDLPYSDRHIRRLKRKKFDSAMIDILSSLNSNDNCNLVTAVNDEEKNYERGIQAKTIES